MKQRKRRNLIGRACGVVAVVFVLLYSVGRWATNVVVISPDMQWVAVCREGNIAVVHDDTALFAMVKESNGDYRYFTVWDTTQDRRRLEPRRTTAPAPPPPATRQRTSVTWFRPSAGLSFTHRKDESLTRPVPLWCIGVPFALLAGYTEYRHRRRVRIGVCPECGHSRTGIAADAVCPECGKSAQAKAI